MSPAELTEATNQTVKKNELSDGYIRLIVTRGAGKLGISPLGCGPAQIINHR